jgi:hypothetical protein
MNRVPWNLRTPMKQLQISVQKITPKGDVVWYIGGEGRLLIFIANLPRHVAVNRL